MPPGLNAYETRLLALERLLRVTEADLLATEGERDALAAQLHHSQSQAAALSKEVLYLQLLRNQLVLDKLDAGERAEELALRHAARAEDAERAARVLRKVREENRGLRRENEALRRALGLGLEDEGGVATPRPKLRLREPRPRDEKPRAEAGGAEAGGSASTYSLPSLISDGGGGESRRSSLLVWVEAYGALVELPPADPPRAGAGLLLPPCAESSPGASGASTPKPASRRTTFGGRASWRPGTPPPPLPPPPPPPRSATYTSNATVNGHSRASPASPASPASLASEASLPPPRMPLAWPAWSVHSDSAIWDSGSSHFGDVESMEDDDGPDFSLIDPDHIALIEVSDAGH